MVTDLAVQSEVSLTHFLLSVMRSAVFTGGACNHPGRWAAFLTPGKQHEAPNQELTGDLVQANSPSSTTGLMMQLRSTPVTL